MASRSVHDEKKFTYLQQRNLNRDAIAIFNLLRTGDEQVHEKKNT